MDAGDNFGRLLTLLLITLIICVGLYWLPDSFLSHKIKKVDLLSDIRVKPVSISMDSLRAQLLLPELPEIDTIAVNDSLIQAGLIDKKAIVLRDSLYKVMSASRGADSSGVHIEDYSVAHTGLKRFFAALGRSAERPVRIAFMGDSFIEGDIMVADFRNEMQKLFGGRGVGFVPVTSKTSQFRPTIDQQAEGWITRSILYDKKQTYTMPGMTFEVKSDDAALSFKTATYFNRLKKVSSLKLIYEQTEGVSMQLACNGLTDTLTQVIATPNQIDQFVIKSDSITEGQFIFSQAKGFRALGLALEDDWGVVVDNYSLRGNSGLLIENLDPLDCVSFSRIRPYDLIILQYGLNVIDEDMLEYGWYKARMVEAIRHLRSCFPESDVLLLGISDRCNQYNGEFGTMPAVLALLHTQRQIARNAGIPFWNTFGAMGGENSMVQFVDKGWASKDYTHLSFRGGREIARSLIKALMLEKKFYDEADKVIY
ncbi:lysophospholipase L1-like esterase [Parabacteroides sp. PF5-5]|uniref:GDSL-type esterase/lipase family protein n=1 Tax=unclassified Parabacteroides TaxID=2649774 RepID=UPI0024767EFD|nr:MULTISPECIES: GDSL-type esterase/lipase family protein [unclassified Parabacteroides]MDH6305828.1 lysophospholipase L1-like esterase [Parabacteroides sp. PH5-39]MDH6317358.1 lysophospholipase L1-like esterase [Parabacteroides sp. PF5-13]MDH6320566.1 lysophospholipase L1-like esterase [Parabacteroides sp. PH5-13]MDH6324271.1 lysophospholipase L1-like esterase [Parabacteroides sp. PH5-8]MDH6328468.1 lysophospholipase L1-like esterase [Parabacteroides sp. PH5-41]